MVLDGEPSINMPEQEKCVFARCCPWHWPFNPWHCKMSSKCPVDLV